MKVEDLRSKHKYYNANLSDWNLFRMAYNGGKKFIQYAIGDKHPRESNENYEARLREGININYCSAIIDIYNFYLTEKMPIRDLTKIELGDDPLWKMFLSNCDYSGTDFNTFMNDAHKEASFNGTVGILVTKPKNEFTTRKQEIDNHVYPYLVLYGAEDILDWKITPHPTRGVPVLSYLKLRDPDSNQERYLIYELDRWTYYEIQQNKTNGLESTVIIDSGDNWLGEIPFVFMPNIKIAGRATHGKSDLTDIAPMVASIIRNMSGGDEIIKWAAFPIFKEPMFPDDVIEEGDEIEVGITAVKHFHKDYGEPGWIETAVADPISAILSWVNFKADELYRTAHLSGVHGQRKSENSQASGLALRYEFQQLKTVLGKKADAVAEAERQIIRYWCLWQNMKVAEEDIIAYRSKDFSIDDLAMDLENLIVSMRSVVSERFRVLVQKHIARRTLVDMQDADHKIVDSEIEKNKGKIEFDEKGNRRQDVPVPKTPVVQNKS